MYFGDSDSPNSLKWSSCVLAYYLYSDMFTQHPLINGSNNTHQCSSSITAVEASHTMSVFEINLIPLNVSINNYSLIIYFNTFDIGKMR